MAITKRVIAHRGASHNRGGGAALGIGIESSAALVAQLISLWRSASIGGGGGGSAASRHRSSRCRGGGVIWSALCLGLGGGVIGASMAAALIARRGSRPHRRRVALGGGARRVT